MDNLLLLVILLVIGAVITVSTMLIGVARHARESEDWKDWLMASYFGLGITVSVVVMLFNA